MSLSLLISVNFTPKSVHSSSTPAIISLLKKVFCLKNPTLPLPNLNAHETYLYSPLPFMQCFRFCATNRCIFSSLLKEKIKSHPEAKKLYQTYRYKIIGGSVVASAGVVTLNHSLGTISHRNPHNWRITSAGIGLIGAGLLITKGAKKKRAKAFQLVKEKKSSPLLFNPTDFA